MTRCNTRQILACSLAGMCTLALVTADGRANSSIFSKTLPSTTWILAGSSMGSGVLVDAQRRLVLTNHHVVAETAEVTVVFPEFANGHLQAERDYYTRHISEIGISGRVLRSDADRDLALVELSRLPSHAQQIALGPSAAPGDDVHCVGNPGTSDALWNYTCGKVRSNYYRMFQTSVAHRMQVVETSAPINPGDSGGPIVNNEGQLVAISQSYLIAGRLVSIGVDITEITWFLHKASGAVSQESPTSGTTAEAGPTTTQPSTCGGSTLSIAVDGGNNREVFVASEVLDYQGLRTRRVWSVAMVLESESLDASLAHRLLEQNARTKIGGWVLERLTDGRTQVIFCAHVDADAPREQLAATAHYVARVASLLAASEQHDPSR